MAASTPSTPTMRRSATTPLRPKEPLRRDSLPTSPDPQIETLYAHPYAKVLSFNAVAPSDARPISRDSSVSVDEAPGSLPWTSRSERTIAVGPLRIYRTPNSVVFLNCGSVVRPIFQKTKCWCVEQAAGKFVLEMRKPQYWRLEVPNTNEEDIQRMARLKEVLNEMLSFEKTACPFQRNFTVALPPGADTPVVYRPWKARERPKIESQDSEEGFLQLKENKTPNKKEDNPEPEGSEVISLKIHKTRPTAELNEELRLATRKPLKVLELRSNFEGITNINEPALRPALDTQEAASEPFAESGSPLPTPVITPESKPIVQVVEEAASETITTPTVNSENDERYNTSGTADQIETEHESDATDDSNITPRTPPTRSSQVLKIPGESLLASRSVTAPPQLTLVASPPSKQVGERSPLEPSMSRGRAVSNESVNSVNSAVSETDSFHSVESWHSPITPLPPSPPQSNPASPTVFPYPHENIRLARQSHHARGLSELTTRSTTPKPWQETPSAFGACLPSDFDESAPQPYRRPSLPVPADLDNDIDPEHFDLPQEVPADGINTNLANLPARLRSRTETLGNCGRRAFSPLPPAANIFSPKRTRRPRHLQTTRHLPIAIIQKTYEILVSPPGHLVKLMMEWAARIARDGLWSQEDYTYENEGSEDWGVDGQSGQYIDEYLDDYGIAIEPVLSKAKSKGLKSLQRRRMERGESWEVD